MEDFRNRLIEFFRDNDPSQIDIVDSYVLRFQGRERILMTVLNKKYGRLVPPPEVIPDRFGLVEIYRQFCPEKLHLVPQILAGFEGREDQLIEALKRKYGIVKVKVMPTPEEIKNDALTERLTKFFTAFNPSRIDAIPEILQSFQGDELTLFKALAKKYVAVPASEALEAEMSKKMTVLPADDLGDLLEEAPAASAASETAPAVTSVESAPSPPSALAEPSAASSALVDSLLDEAQEVGFFDEEPDTSAAAAEAEAKAAEEQAAREREREREEERQRAEAQLAAELEAELSAPVPSAAAELDADLFGTEPEAAPEPEPKPAFKPKPLDDDPFADPDFDDPFARKSTAASPKPAASTASKSSPAASKPAAATAKVSTTAAKPAAKVAAKPAPPKTSSVFGDDLDGFFD